MTTEIAWRKSSRCGTSTCIEVARHGNDYLIRDSKNPDAAPLSFNRRAWTAFHDSIATGELHIP